MEQKQEQPLQVKESFPHLAWPTSKPGPQAMQPPPGQKPMPGRTDQVMEINYNQETGTPATDGSLPATLPREVLKKRKRK